ncbi:MAG: hypothetical protein HY821_10880 [Acidobacteria bacterium]|nr:hypothetical protein [Acidobacteriota bacterium]
MTLLNLLGSRTFAACAALLAISSIPASAQYGGFGGFGGMGNGLGMGAPDSAGTSGGSSPRLSFAPWISATGSYYETLASASNHTPSTHSYGYGGAAGLSGGKAWNRTSLAGMYTASYQHYNGSYSSGISQVGALSVQHRASDRVTVFASEFLGSSNGGYGYGAPAGNFGGWGTVGSGALADLAPGGVGNWSLGSNGLVDNETFATRVSYSGTTGGVSYRPSLRSSLSAVGSASFVRRKGYNLSDLNSVSGGGQYAYMFSQQTQLGVFYQFGQFSYPQLFGGNKVNQTGISLMHRFNPQTSMTVTGGAYQFRTTYLGSVQMDPTLSGLLGQSSILSVSNIKQIGWMGSASLNRAWRRWSAAANYDHGINPGNGFILASRRDNATLSGSTNLSRLNIGAFAGYYRLSGVIQHGASTDGVSLGVNTGFRIAGDLFFGVSAGYSNYSTNTSARRWSRFASVSVSWSPSDAAFRF